MLGTTFLSTKKVATTAMTTKKEERTPSKEKNLSS